MQIFCKCDLWEHLAATHKTVVLYGMGNGADKILSACAEKGVTVSGCFASDGFARGHSFHGFPVLTWSETRARYGAENLIVLLSFGTSRPEVLENIRRIAAEAELYAPDVPAFGEGLFDRAFFEENRAELEVAYSQLSDEESRQIFENVINFKLSGDIRFLEQAESNPDTVMRELICPQKLTAFADLGAYNGDTVREILDSADGNVKRVFAMEPDARNFKKLAAYAERETRAAVQAVQAGAWSDQATLFFDAEGNRNATLSVNRSQILDGRPIRQRETLAMPLDTVLGGERVDYIKYDVEGAEREALIGSSQTIKAYTPTLLVSLYHRNEDLFALPLLIRERFSNYASFYLRRFAGVPAWDLNLYCKM